MLWRMTPSSIYIILHVWLFIQIVPTILKHANLFKDKSLAPASFRCFSAISSDFLVERNVYSQRYFPCFSRVVFLSFCAMFWGSSFSCSFGVFRLLITCKILRQHTWLIVFFFCYSLDDHPLQWTNDGHIYCSLLINTLSIAIILNGYWPSWKTRVVAENFKHIDALLSRKVCSNFHLSTTNLVSVHIKSIELK